MTIRRNPKYKYLKTEEFTSLCSFLLVDLGKRPEELLEAYEQHGLIRPIYRLQIPEAYAKDIFQNKYDRDSQQEKLADFPAWDDIDNFLGDRLLNYHATYSPWIEHTMSEGHPLDWAYKEGKPFVRKPAGESFTPWADYKIVVGEIEGHLQHGTVAEHYYSQWQVLLVEEADTLFSRIMNPFLPLSHEFDLPTRTLSLSEYTEAFEILAEYRFRKQLIFEKYMNQSANNVLEGSPLRGYYAEIEKQAAITFSEISEKRLIEFLRKLCEVYFRYKRTEKVKLSKLLKSHIVSVVNVYLNATKNSYLELLKAVEGDIRGDEQWYDLEIILPDEKKEKKRAGVYFNSFKDEFNSIFPSLSVSAGDIDEIIEQATINGNGALLASVVNIEKYRVGEIFKYEDIWNCYIGALTTAVETFGKEKYPNVKYLSNCIDQSNGQCQNLKQNFFDKYLNNNSLPVGFSKSITDASEPAEFLFKLDILTNSTRYGISVPNDLLALKFFLITHLTRNFVNHTTKIDMELFGSRFEEIYKSLIFSIFYFKKCRKSMP